ncbi:hypothetical protein HPDFL43_12373 [Hoeflea phototrophica DFL-43]|jgi:hypothetical protein|uniref:Uncharacterized protein n=1 Tax=Hoeflea phototrophica (strain DSM 17068 / NCIMB 14078 / DFL-43) TaxID=411684 RepID=A9DHJ9_HOEPD|nr:hypothetical protein [Hoeflea phototrophica]EDQ31446.1 hypothetical protein HPDFL43_12373 [Hoeflea phototrophica DFL-43]
MRIRTHRTLSTLLRIVAFTAFFVGPVGAFAYAQTGDKGPGLSGAGFVLYMSIQRGR